MRDKILRVAVRGALSAGPLVRVLGARRTRATPDLDPQVAAVLELQRLSGLKPLEARTPADARAFAAEGLSPLDPDPEPMDRVIDIAAPGPAGAIPIASTCRPARARIGSCTSTAAAG